ncbi:hypothetical protein [Kocuria sp. ZOR0020]|uniref:hypothetical protein n=1 Tax=Kocuria sp. ZOR0020 TaxID=1339234 RepID=UPI0012E08972|nr:hypothetical protein [Kocuria sp. ZOR0020]
MIRRLTLLLVVMAIPVLTALGTQQLARTTAPPALPTDPVTSQTVDGTSQDTSQDPDHGASPGPRSGSVAPVVPGSVDQNGDVTAPGVGASTPADDDIVGDVEDDIDHDDDDFADADEHPETGTVDR